jgi:hypothetical protein
MYIPKVSDSARLRVGFGIGSQFAGLKVVGM